MYEAFTNSLHVTKYRLLLHAHILRMVQRDRLPCLRVVKMRGEDIQTQATAQSTPDLIPRRASTSLALRWFGFESSDVSQNANLQTLQKIGCSQKQLEDQSLSIFELPTALNLRIMKSFGSHLNTTCLQQTG